MPVGVGVKSVRGARWHEQGDSSNYSQLMPCTDLAYLVLERHGLGGWHPLPRRTRGDNRGNHGAQCCNGHCASCHLDTVRSLYAASAARE